MLNKLSFCLFSDDVMMTMMIMIVLRMKVLVAEDILPLHQNSVTKSTIAGSGAQDKKLPEFCPFFPAEISQKQN